MNRPIIRQSFLFALGVVLYVSFVAFIMNHAEKLFGPEKSLLGPIAFLLLFIISAAITGSLVFGKPVMLYFDGKKPEAVKSAATTIGFLALFALALLVALFLMR